MLIFFRIKGKGLDSDGEISAGLHKKNDDSAQMECHGTGVFLPRPDRLTAEPMAEWFGDCTACVDACLEGLLPETRFGQVR